MKVQQEKIDISTLAKRFRNFTPSEKVPESMNVFYESNNSIGNRYVNWRSIHAKQKANDGDNVITIDRLYKETAHSACEWSHLFEGIHHGLIVGPRVLSALDTCLDIMRNDEPPEDDGTKVRNVNRLGGVNYISKSVDHDWKLTDRLGKIMSDAFFADRHDKILYSEKWIYVFNSHSGWSRST